MKRYMVNLNEDQKLNAAELLALIMDDKGENIHPTVDNYLDHMDMKICLNNMVVSEALKACEWLLASIENQLYLTDILVNPTDYV